MVAIYVVASTFSELEEIFEKLSEGSARELLDELGDTPFGAYGHLADRYDVHWFFRSEAGRESP